MVCWWFVGVFMAFQVTLLNLKCPPSSHRFWMGWKNFTSQRWATHECSESFTIPVALALSWSLAVKPIVLALFNSLKALIPITCVWPRCCLKEIGRRCCSMRNRFMTLLPNSGKTLLALIVWVSGSFFFCCCNLWPLLVQMPKVNFCNFWDLSLLLHTSNISCTLSK